MLKNSTFNKTHATFSFNVTVLSKIVAMFLHISRLHRKSSSENYFLIAKLGLWFSIIGG